MNVYNTQGIIFTYEHISGGFIDGLYLPPTPLRRAFLGLPLLAGFALGGRAQGPYLLAQWRQLQAAYGRASLGP